MNIRRILVALDASPQSMAALEAAAEMAAHLDAELFGLFVEDINLLRMAQMPFARLVGKLSTTRRELDSDSMERMMRAMAAEARRALAEMAGRRRLRWSFRVARGAVVEQLTAAATEADLLALGRASRTLSRQFRLGSTALSLLTQSPCAVLLLCERVSVRGPILAVFDGSRGAQSALSTAMDTAKAWGQPLVVLVLASDADEAARLQKDARHAIGKTPVRFRTLLDGTVAALVRAVREEGAGALVLSCRDCLQETEIRMLIEQVDCPVFLLK